MNFRQMSDTLQYLTRVALTRSLKVSDVFPIINCRGELTHLIMKKRNLKLMMGLFIFIIIGKALLTTLNPPLKMF